MFESFRRNFGCLLLNLASRATAAGASLECRGHRDLFDGERAGAALKRQKNPDLV